MSSKESDLRSWRLNENKDHLYSVSLNVQDPILMVGPDGYLAASLTAACRWQSIEVWMAFFTLFAF